jgi:hypothetical protein
MVAVGAGERQPQPVTGPDQPGGRMQRNLQSCRFAGHEMTLRLKRAGMIRAGVRVIGRRLGDEAATGAQCAFGDVAGATVGRDIFQIDDDGGVRRVGGNPEVGNRRAR